MKIKKIFIFLLLSLSIMIMFTGCSLSSNEFVSAAKNFAEQDYSTFYYKSTSVLLMSYSADGESGDVSMNIDTEIIIDASTSGNYYYYVKMVAYGSENVTNTTETSSVEMEAYIDGSTYKFVTSMDGSKVSMQYDIPTLESTIDSTLEEVMSSYRLDSVSDARQYLKIFNEVESRKENDNLIVEGTLSDNDYLLSLFDLEDYLLDDMEFDGNLNMKTTFNEYGYIVALTGDGTLSCDVDGISMTVTFDLEEEVKYNEVVDTTVKLTSGTTLGDAV